jgi:hypothetical protein
MPFRFLEIWNHRSVLTPGEKNLFENPRDLIKWSRNNRLKGVCTFVEHVLEVSYERVCFVYGLMSLIRWLPALLKCAVVTMTRLTLANLQIPSSFAANMFQDQERLCR